MWKFEIPKKFKKVLDIQLQIQFKRLSIKGITNIFINYIDVDAFQGIFIIRKITTLKCL